MIIKKKGELIYDKQYKKTGTTYCRNSKFSL